MIELHPLRVALTLALLGFVACTDDDFPVYEEIEGLRVLAIQADPPAIAPGESTTLRALVFDDGGDLDDVEYTWSWCPFREPAEAGAECAVTEQQLADEFGLPDVSYELGEAETAELTHTVPVALLEAVCGGADEDEAEQAGELGFLIDCDQGFPVSVELIATRDDTTIRSIKEVRLLFDDSAPPETNPRIDGITHSWVPTGVDRDACADAIAGDICGIENVEDFDPRDLDPIEGDGSTELRLGESYVLFADVPEDATEVFIKPPEGFDEEPEEKRENLTISWFVSSGSLDEETSGFTDGVTELENIRDNIWDLPKRGDEEESEAWLYLVIRDERGGTGWLERRVVLDRDEERE